VATQIGIYNMALSYLTLSARVQSLTENTPQAGACNTFYDNARKRILEQAYWSFASKAVAMQLTLDQTSLGASAIAFPGWNYIYQRPVDCLKARAVTTQYGLRVNPYLSYWWQPSGQTNGWGPFRPPWEETLSSDGSTVQILTDQPSAWLVYTIDPPNINLAPEVFADCVAWELATLVAGPVSANQKAADRAGKMAMLSLSRALAQNLNEQQPDTYPESPSISGRQ